MSVRLLSVVAAPELVTLSRECGFETIAGRPGFRAANGPVDVVLVGPQDLDTVGADVARIVCLPRTEIERAAALLTAGVADEALFLPASAENLRLAVIRTAARRGAIRERDQLRAWAERSLESELPKERRARERLEEAIARVASTPRTTVLVVGGTRAARVAAARSIHARSARSRAPFLEWSTAGDDLLFAARGGTIFADDVATLGPEGQARLAELLAAGGEYDVRCIAGSASDLERACEEGRFSEELYYRLNVLSIALPGAAAPIAPQREDDGLSLPLGDLSVRAMERALIERVLELSGGNRSEAARLLQVNRATLYNKLRTYGLGES